MKKFEKNLYKKGLQFVAGVDEVGRGPLAGPVVCAAVIFPPDYVNPEIKDSKQLSAHKREQLATIIKQHALAYAIVYIDEKTIDELNVKAASRLGMKQALQQLKVVPQHVLVDFEKLDITWPQISIVKGDEKSQTIAAASILAKVDRDAYMDELDKAHPQYDWKNNKGYGTKKHCQAIEKHGWTKHHRLSFNPVKNFISTGNNNI